MPNLHKVESETRKYIDELSKLTGLPKDVVSTVLDGVRLLTLHDLYEKGVDDSESGDMGTKPLEIVIPHMAIVSLMPIHRNKNAEGFSGYTFKGKVHFRDKFTKECKSAYYGTHDYLLDRCREKFSEHVISEYKSLI